MLQGKSNSNSLRFSLNFIPILHSWAFEALTFPFYFESTEPVCKSRSNLEKARQLQCSIKHIQHHVFFFFSFAHPFKYCCFLLQHCFFIYFTAKIKLLICPEYPDESGGELLQYYAVICLFFVFSSHFDLKAVWSDLKQVKVYFTISVHTFRSGCIRLWCSFKPGLCWTRCFDQVLLWINKKIKSNHSYYWTKWINVFKDF